MLRSEMAVAGGTVMTIAELEELELFVYVQKLGMDRSS